MKTKKTNAKPCKECGTCPTCGRSPAPAPMLPQIIIVQPAAQPAPPLMPPWYAGPIWIAPFQGLPVPRPFPVTYETVTTPLTGGPNGTVDLGNGYRPAWGQQFC